MVVIHFVIHSFAQDRQPPMSTRTVRLDDEGEQRLADLRERTGFSISDVFKNALEHYTKVAPSKRQKTSYEIYCELDIGAGSGNADGSVNVKTKVAEIIRKKHGR